MRIPHEQLSPATLRAVVQEFVTRDGTDHSLVERRIEAVLHQLDAGRAELHFDGETETCNIVPVDVNRAAEGGAMSLAARLMSTRQRRTGYTVTAVITSLVISKRGVRLLRVKVSWFEPVFDSVSRRTTNLRLKVHFTKLVFRGPSIAGG